MVSSPLFLIVVVILLILCVRGIWRVYANYAEATSELHRLQAELDKTQKRDAELNASMRKIGSPEGNDYEIRNRLDVAKPDEKVIHIINTSENAEANESR